ncbi:MAG: dodecin domain-containing protein [Bacteroidetes bacterium]|nr:dodecin domain-containing protein [Bacteroidota bacterium]
MANTFEYREVVGISTNGIEDAIREGLNEIKSSYDIAWFEVVSMRGRMVDDHVIEHQVSLKIGCRAK